MTGRSSDYVRSFVPCTPARPYNCEEFAAAARHILAIKPEMTFLVARWTLYANGWIYRGRLQRNTHFISDDLTESHRAADSRQVLGRLLPATVAVLSKSTDLIIAKQTPDLPDEIANVFLRQQADPSYALPGIAAQYASRRFVDELVDGLAQTRQLSVIDPVGALCNVEACLYRDADGFFYTDDNHISIHGGERLDSLVYKFFERR
jgi:hypothetical protein